MLKICVVRHGETEWNKIRRCQGREDIELNENGRNQALCVAGDLRNFQCDIIMSSPLKRAYETAEIIGSILGISEVIIEESFVERDYGAAAGLTFEQKSKDFPNDIIPGIENDYTLKERITRGLNLISQRYNNHNIVLVTHGGVINSLLGILSDGKVDIGETNIKNGAMNIITYDSKEWFVINSGEK